MSSEDLSGAIKVAKYLMKHGDSTISKIARGTNYSSDRVDVELKLLDSMNMITTTTIPRSKINYSFRDQLARKYYEFYKELLEG